MRSAPGHDDDGVFEGHLATLAVGDHAVVQDLQQGPMVFDFISFNQCRLAIAYSNKDT